MVLSQFELPGRDPMMRAALPITSARRFLRASRRPELLDQRTNQAQQLLLLWAAAGPDEKRSDLHVGDLAP
jgi:hypothetical protein